MSDTPATIEAAPEAPISIDMDAVGQAGVITDITLVVDAEQQIRLVFQVMVSGGKFITAAPMNVTQYLSPLYLAYRGKTCRVATDDGVNATAIDNIGPDSIDLDAAK